MHASITRQRLSVAGIMWVSNKNYHSNLRGEKNFDIRFFIFTFLVLYIKHIIFFNPIATVNFSRAKDKYIIMKFSW